MPSEDQLNALQSRIAPAAVESEKRTGIPAEVSTAQCILESGWLQHSPSNNCFGIKWSESSGLEKQLLPTKEWFTDQELVTFLAARAGREATPLNVGIRVNGKREYLVKDWFAVYPTLADCFDAHGALLAQSVIYETAKQYLQPPVVSRQDAISKFIDAIATHYATDPKYAESLKEIAFMPEVTQAIQAARAIRLTGTIT